MLLKISKYFPSKKHQNDESGAAMIFALVVMLIALTVSVLVAGFVMTSIGVTKGVNSISTNNLATETAINNAVLVANSQNGKTLLAQHSGVNNAVTGTLPANASPYTVKWRWYSQQVAGTGQRIYYYIYATGYTTTPEADDAKTTRVLLSSKNVSSASITNGKIVYQPSDQAVHQWGITGLNGINLAAGAKVYSYDSYQNRNPTGVTSNAEIASNGNVQLSGDNAVRKFNQFATGGTTARCSGPDCADLVVEPISYQLSLSTVADKVAAECPNAASTYPTWKASSNAGMLSVTSTNKCFNTMDFDVNTNLPASASPNAPVQAFVKGNIIVRSGVKVNDGGAPASLQLYSQAGASASFAPGASSSATTEFFGLIAGPTLVCANTGTTASNLFIYGSLACGTVTMSPGGVIWNDDGSKLVKSTSDRVLWSISKYENIV